ncbi:MAG: hypothetical protein ACREHD_12850 [Pirellulales bacterium]
MARSEIPVISKGTLIAIAGGAALLPVAISVVLATGFLFASLQDLVAARILNGIALGLGLLWVIDLIALVVLLGFDAAARSDAGGEVESDEQEPI